MRSVHSLPCRTGFKNERTLPTLIQHWNFSGQTRDQEGPHFDLPKSPGFSKSGTFAVMGNSASSGFITPTPRKLSWGRPKEDTEKLEDYLTQQEEDLWRTKGKQFLSVKKVNLTRSVRYVDLAVQESNSFYPTRGEMLNPAFVGDQGP